MRDTLTEFDAREPFARFGASCRWSDIRSNWCMDERYIILLAARDRSADFSGLALAVDILLSTQSSFSSAKRCFGAWSLCIRGVTPSLIPSFWLAFAAALMTGILVGIVGGLIANRVHWCLFPR